jgi:hypothetical protein
LDLILLAETYPELKRLYPPELRALIDRGRDRKISFVARGRIVCRSSVTPGNRHQPEIQSKKK